MVRKVIWSFRAQEDRKNILGYWNQRNKSNSYSKKLNRLFKDALRLIALHPNIGRLTDDGKKIRIKIVHDYFIIYECSEESIFVLCLWDSRQRPDKLKKILGD